LLSLLRDMEAVPPANKETAPSKRFSLNKEILLLPPELNDDVPETSIVPPDWVIAPVLLMVKLPPDWLMPVIFNAPLLVNEISPLLVLVALSVFAELRELVSDVPPIDVVVKSPVEINPVPVASVIVPAAFSVTLLVPARTPDTLMASPVEVRSIALADMVTSAAKAAALEAVSVPRPFMTPVKSIALAPVLVNVMSLVPPVILPIVIAPAPVLIEELPVNVVTVLSETASPSVVMAALMVFEPTFLVKPPLKLKVSPPPTPKVTSPILVKVTAPLNVLLLPVNTTSYG